MKVIRVHMPRVYWNLNQKNRKSSAPVGVQLSRDQAYRYFGRVEIDGPSKVIYNDKARSMNGDAFRITTNSPIRCYDMEGKLVEEID